MPKSQQPLKKKYLHQRTNEYRPKKLQERRSDAKYKLFQLQYRIRDKI